MAQSSFFQQVVDQAPINIMVCDLDDFIVRYANPASIATLKRLAHLLPIAPEEIVGTSIDVFHRHPAHQRGLLRDPTNLPHRARIRLGSEALDLFVTALVHEGALRALMLTWSVATREVETAERFEREVKGAVDTLGRTVPTLEQTASTLNFDAAATSEHTQMVVQASQRLAQSTTQIADRVATAARTGTHARNAVTATYQRVNDLREAATSINAVADLIRGVAERTNLLALNATIEAARSGEAGRGFAVVAQEVKALAQQTTAATQDIAGRVELVRSQTGSVLDAIDQIGQAVGALDEVTSAITIAAEEQMASSREVGTAIDELLEMGEKTRRAALNVGQVGDSIGKEMGDLEKVVATFLKDVRARAT
jgi:methyl-accepting chemotaxis protein